MGNNVPPGYKQTEATVVGAIIVGAIHELPLRTVPRPGGNNGK